MPASVPFRTDFDAATFHGIVLMDCAGWHTTGKLTASIRWCRKSLAIRLVALSCSSTKANFDVRSMATNICSLNVTREDRRRLAAVVSNRSAPQTADPTRVLAAVKRGKQALESLHSHDC